MGREDRKGQRAPRRGAEASAEKVTAKPCTGTGVCSYLRSISVLAAASALFCDGETKLREGVQMIGRPTAHAQALSPLLLPLKLSASMLREAQARWSKEVSTGKRR